MEAREPVEGSEHVWQQQLQGRQSIDDRTGPIADTQPTYLFLHQFTFLLKRVLASCAMRMLRSRGFSSSEGSPPACPR